MEPITDTWEELAASHKVMNIWIELAVPKIHLGFGSLISPSSTPSNSANRLWATESSSLPLLCCLNGEEKGKFWSLQRRSILPSYKHMINHLHNESTLHPESWQCCSCFLDWAGGMQSQQLYPWEWTVTCIDCVCLGHFWGIGAFGKSWPWLCKQKQASAFGLQLRIPLTFQFLWSPT